MAHLSHRRPENVAGDFYVDTSCIDCDTCRWMAPEIFQRQGQQSVVYQQPGADGLRPHRLAALQALLACPTASIGTVTPPADIKAAQQSLPLLIATTPEGGVFHCGYHAESSFGAASYLIQRSAGNILVDSPRFTPPLVQRLEALGGVKTLYLTHRDDVADHAKFHQHFGCDRILHADDVTASTRAVEHQPTGTAAFELAPDLLIIPVPGHTAGHTVLLYRQQFLFSGDHLAWSPQQNQLVGFREACWYSWPQQIRSMEALAKYGFEWVLPGHGRRYQADRATMAQAMQQCIAWMNRDQPTGEWD
jgi:glyoxylase-like metal-dependent hydrolase (beta-lactamase superfamily II)/ferredoxin